MHVYAGIDEAGYGPMFGPFVLARSVFVFDDDTATDPIQNPPCLWETLNAAVCRQASDKRRRIAINDSKKLYTPKGKAGLKHLERGVLAFAGLAKSLKKTDTLESLLDAIGNDSDSRIPDILWYQDEQGGPQLPLHHTADQIGIASAGVRRAGEAVGLKHVGLSAAVVYEDRFNKLIDATRSKARCTWTFVARHLHEIWTQYGNHSPRVVVDRQGGRKVYHQLLQLLFQDAELRLIDESDDISCYQMIQGERSMTVSFETGADLNHLPVALGAMTAKYLRELLMIRFNRYFANQVPQIKPTAGYVQDGRRFLAEIEPVIRSLSIDRDLLIRRR